MYEGVSNFSIEIYNIFYTSKCSHSTTWLISGQVLIWNTTSKYNWGSNINTYLYYRLWIAVQGDRAHFILRMLDIPVNRQLTYLLRAWWSATVILAGSTLVFLFLYIPFQQTVWFSGKQMTWHVNKHLYFLLPIQLVCCVYGNKFTWVPSYLVPWNRESLLCQQ